MVALSSIRLELPEVHIEGFRCPIKTPKVPNMEQSCRTPVVPLKRRLVIKEVKKAVSHSYLGGSDGDFTFKIAEVYET